MRYAEFTSEELWIHMLPGDHLALDAIVKRHYNLLYQYGCKFTRDASQVKDCIQDLFLYIWQRRHAISETPSVEHYLMKALRRRLTAQQREDHGYQGFHPCCSFLIAASRPRRAAPCRARRAPCG